MAQNKRNAYLVTNSKLNNANLIIRLDELETSMNNMKKEIDQNLKAIFQQMQANTAKGDQVCRQISQLQQQTDADSKRISSLEQNRANDNGKLVKNVENVLSSIKSQAAPAVAPPKDLLSVVKNNLAFQFANDVGSVVGLKEAITWKSRWLQLIWTATLFAGIIATAWFVYSSTVEYLEEPTVTKVKLMSQPSYDYPPLLLCSAAWLDAAKPLSLGLSLDGLKYSLGYINNRGDKPIPANITKAKQEFIEFFKERNYNSFTDYLMTISNDVPVIQSIEDYANYLSTSALCTYCRNDTLLFKTVIDGQMCYSFHLRLENDHRSMLQRFISIKLDDHTAGLIQSAVWTLYVNADVALRTPTVPEMVIDSFNMASIRITSEQFSVLNTLQSPCVSETNLEERDSQQMCTTKCLVPLYRQNLNCTPHHITPNTINYHPAELCNTFDIKADATLYWALQDVIRKNVENVTSSKEAEKCFQKCPQKCQRTTYEAARQRDVSFADLNPAAALLASQVRLLNISIVGLVVEHAAVYQGGIITRTEVYTISFTTLVSNIGGALGLFVGGTVMTFVQLILFFVKFALEKRNKIEDDVFIRTRHVSQ